MRFILGKFQKQLGIIKMIPLKSIFFEISMNNLTYIKYLFSKNVDYFSKDIVNVIKLKEKLLKICHKF